MKKLILTTLTFTTLVTQTGLASQKSFEKCMSGKDYLKSITSKNSSFGEDMKGLNTKISHPIISACHAESKNTNLYSDQQLSEMHQLIAALVGIEASSGWNLIRRQKQGARAMRSLKKAITFNPLNTLATIGHANTLIGYSKYPIPKKGLRAAGINSFQEESERALRAIGMQLVNKEELALTQQQIKELRALQKDLETRF